MHHWMKSFFFLTCADLLPIYIDRGAPLGVSHNVINHLITANHTLEGQFAWEGTYREDVMSMCYDRRQQHGIHGAVHD